MYLVANRKNLKAHSKRLLANSPKPEAEKELIQTALNGFERNSGHISHDRANHLEKLNGILGTHGVEGMLLDRQGNDVSGDCSMRNVACDIQYCNTGDTYGVTLFYFQGKLRIGDWGSIVERLN